MRIIQEFSARISSGGKAFAANIVKKENTSMLDKIALFLLIVGGLNWGLVGIFQFDLVAFLFGGSAAIISRIVYVVIAICAIWCVSLFFKDSEMVEDSRAHMGR